MFWHYVSICALQCRMSSGLAAVGAAFPIRPKKGRLSAPALTKLNHCVVKERWPYRTGTLARPVFFRLLLLFNHYRADIRTRIRQRFNPEKSSCLRFPTSGPGRCFECPLCSVRLFPHAAGVVLGGVIASDQFLGQIPRKVMRVARLAAV